MNGPHNGATARPAVDTLQHGLPDPKEKSRDGAVPADQGSASSPFLRPQTPQATVLCFHRLFPPPAESSHPQASHTRRTEGTCGGPAPQPRPGEAGPPPAWKRQQLSMFGLKKNKNRNIGTAACLNSSLLRGALQLPWTAPAHPQAAERSAAGPRGAAAVRECTRKDDNVLLA